MPQDQPQVIPTQSHSVAQPQAQPMTAPSIPPQNIVGAAEAITQQHAAQPQKSLEVRFEDDLILYVSQEVVDDMRFLEHYEQLSENQSKIPSFLRFIFGEEAYQGIYKYYESKGQRFTITKMTEVFNKLDADLNSNPDFLSR